MRKLMREGRYVGNEQFRVKNHYLPCAYLRGFADSDGEVCVYRTLVSHDKVPLWERHQSESVGYVLHLYTRDVAGNESDEIEKWLDREFEAPASDSLKRVLSDDRLTPDDWHRLVRFLAAQSVRTPGYFVRQLPKWREWASPALGESLVAALDTRKEAKTHGKPIVMPESPHADHLPIAVNVAPDPAAGVAEISATALIGRGMWQFAIKTALEGPAKILHEHKWTILSPAQGFSWFTSDDPVIALNYYGDGRYDFGGSWGKPGTHIFLPLSPRHLLFAAVGAQPARRGTVLPVLQTRMIREAIAKCARGMILSSAPDDEVSELAPRVVDQQKFHQGREQWRNWNSDQTAALQKLRSSSKTPAASAVPR